MNLALIAIAFGTAFLANLVRLPPMVGFLAAGFIMHGLGLEGGETLQTLADLGVTLLLFTIGLKLDFRDLIRPEAFGVSILHLLITVLAFGAITFGLGTAGVYYFAGLTWFQAGLIGFALSFSSTVFAVKVLESRGEMGALHGRTAIAILILQDIAAVGFIAATSSSVPSLWALGLLALPAIRPLLSLLLKKSGFGELQILLGFCLALAGYQLFELVGLKGDLGALAIGLLLSGTKQASELAKSLLNFKEIFLIFFFLNIGISGAPSLGTLLVAVALLLLIPLKGMLFFLLLTRFHLRARTSTLTSLSLSCYSEFGLIVASVAVSRAWLPNEWLIILGLTVACSFAFAAPINTQAHHIFDRLAGRLRKLETPTVLPYDRPIEPGNAEIMVFGMGRLGTSAYDTLQERFGPVVLGVDRSMKITKRHQVAARNVVHGDPTDIDFWERTRGPLNIKMAVLAMPGHEAILTAIDEIRSRNVTCTIAAVASKETQVTELERAGAAASYNIYAEAGIGLARDVIGLLEKSTGSAESQEEEDKPT